jgi:hypothetical protein
MNIHDEFADTDDQAAQLTSCCVAHIFPCLTDYSSYFATNAQQPQQPHVCGSSSPSHNSPKGFRYNVVTRSPTGGQKAGILSPYSSSVGIKRNENSNYYPGTSCQRDVFYQPLTQSHDFQNPQSEQLSGENCQQLSQSLEDNTGFSSLLDLNGANDNTQQEVWTPYIPSPAPVSVDFYQENAVGFAEARDSSSVAINRPNNTCDDYTRSSSSRRPSEVSTTSIQNESILIDKGPGKHCERSKSTDATNLTTSAMRFCHGARNRRGISGAITAGGVADYCQNKTCGVSLTHEKPYCQRYRLCKHCIGQLSLIVNGEAKRFCQQCSLLHPIGEFDTDKKSCRKKLAKHALRLRQRRAAKRLLNTNCA